MSKQTQGLAAVMPSTEELKTAGIRELSAEELLTVNGGRQVKDDPYKDRISDVYPSPGSSSGSSGGSSGSSDTSNDSSSDSGSSGTSSGSSSDNSNSGTSSDSSSNTSEDTSSNSSGSDTSDDNSSDSTSPYPDYWEDYYEDEESGSYDNSCNNPVAGSSDSGSSSGSSSNASGNTSSSNSSDTSNDNSSDSYEDAECGSYDSSCNNPDPDSSDSDSSDADYQNDEESGSSDSSSDTSDDNSSDSYEDEECGSYDGSCNNPDPGSSDSDSSDDDYQDDEESGSSGNSSVTPNENSSDSASSNNNYQNDEESGSSGNNSVTPNENSSDSASSNNNYQNDKENGSSGSNLSGSNAQTSNNNSLNGGDSGGSYSDKDNGSSYAKNHSGTSSGGESSYTSPSKKNGKHTVDAGFNSETEHKRESYTESKRGFGERISSWFNGKREETSNNSKQRFRRASKDSTVETQNGPTGQEKQSLKETFLHIGNEGKTQTNKKDKSGHGIMDRSNDIKNDFAAIKNKWKKKEQPKDIGVDDDQYTIPEQLDRPKGVIITFDKSEEKLKVNSYRRLANGDWQSTKVYTIDAHNNVRNELNKERKTPDVTTFPKDGAEPQWYFPRQFPNGSWELGLSRKSNNSDIEGHFIPTTAYQDVPVYGPKSQAQPTPDADGNYIATGVQSDTGYGIHFAAGTTWGCIGLKSISDAMWLAKITDSALLSTNGFARLRVQE